MLLLALIVGLGVVVGLLFVGQTWLAWVLPAVALLAWWGAAGGVGVWPWWVLALPTLLLAALTVHPPTRARTLGKLALKLVAPILPRMSDTEREALEAGTVWWDADLFSGDPDWSKLLRFEKRPLSAREQAFLDGPVEELCGMVDDWAVQRDGDLPPRVWEFLRKHKFFGMIIPEEYGGLGFSGLAHSAVVTKISSRSVTAAVTVMVPNSLGPAELLLHYGTQEEKDRYLPALARGEELPCFALTEPNAGSDAGGMTSRGVVQRGRWRGEEVLGIRLDFDKRYITLAPVATLVGLAFRLEDPDGLLGGEPDLGITCALIPRDTPGVEIGERHDPLGVPFMNGPVRGRGVFVPIDTIIGGRKNAGKGWRMLMQSLAAGRGISLPSMAAGAAQFTARAVGAYATVRQQFGLPIGRFEGVEERLARIGGLAYLLDAARTLTAGAVDAGEQPSVVSAIVKCWATEGMRQVVNDGMDVVGGSGICRGPRNLLAGGYQALPIGITVEGANILTRSMIVFGQGALRCHPFAKEEVAAAAAGDVARFDRAFFGHVGFVFRSAARSLVHGLTGGRLVRAPLPGPIGRHLQQLTRASASFAFVSDVAMGTLGGSLKFREKITGRLADALAWQYLASSAVKRFADEGSRREDLPFARWACERALFEIQVALDETLANFPVPGVGVLLRPVVFPLGRWHRPPSDRLGAEVARALQEPGAARDKLAAPIYVPEREGELGLALLERAYAAVVAAEAVQKKLRDAVKAKRLERKPAATLVQRALDTGVVTPADVLLIERARELRDQAVAVDAFERGAAGSPRREHGVAHSVVAPG